MLLGNYQEASELWINDGAAIFSNFSVQRPGGSAAATLTAAWGDADGDGDLDLFVGVFVQPNCQWAIEI